MSLKSCLRCVVIICFLVSSDVVVGRPLPIKIYPDNSKIHLVGRFTKDYKCAWTGSGFTIKVRGGNVNVLLKDFASGEKYNRTGYNSNYFAVKVDNKRIKTIRLKPNLERYSLLKLSDNKTHVITLFKRTESDVGIVQFKGLELGENTTLLTPPVASKRLLAIGDSITCGYGNGCPKKEWGFTPAEENGYLTYAAIAARILNAEYQCIAASGRGLYRSCSNDTKNQMPSKLQMTISQYRQNDWDMKSWVPDYIVMNLGTNDFSSSIPPEKVFVKTGREFLKTIFTYYPKAKLYILVGPMLMPKKRRVLLKYYKKIVENDTRVRILKFPGTTTNTYGAGYHPNIANHKACGEFLASVIKDSDKK
jgi:lysophospholipase L1-like esterase